MIKIGITGSLSSGKSTASKILSHKRGPLFSADKAAEIIKQEICICSKKFKIDKAINLRNLLKK